MNDFKSKVAVVTGGASGIGYAFAERAVQEGMQVLIADIRPEALAEAEKKLKAAGGEVIAMCVDVRQADQVEALAVKAVEAFGKVNLIFNNAGVFASGLAWETSLDEYRWAIETNLMSVVYGIKSFVPRFLAQGDECHVINVASAAGITCSPGFCMYSTTKHAVVALTEALYLDLFTHQIPNVGVTLVMPGYVQSDVMNPDKVAPNPAVAAELVARLEDPVNGAVEMMMRQGVEEGMPAATAADLVFTAIRDNELYVLPNAEPTLPAAKLVAEGRISAQNRYPQYLSGEF
jgi:NAD(P)-dependent dehydrogenase (short-subunit alcohol dehydrogenase family)